MYSAFNFAFGLVVCLLFWGCGVRGEEDTRLRSGYDNYVTLMAYLPFWVMPSVFEISEFVGSTTSTIPLQSGVRSDDLQIGHTFAVVTNLHLRQAISLAMIIYLPSLLISSCQTALRRCRHPLAFWPAHLYHFLPFQSLLLSTRLYQETAACT